MNLNTINSIIQIEEMVILYVKSHSCNVCVELLPKVQEIADKEKIRFIPIQIEDHREVGSEYNIFSAPTIILFVMGKESYRQGRFLVPSELTATIKKYKNLLL